MTYSTDLRAAKFAPALNKVRFASYSGSPAREIGEGIAIIPGGGAMTMVRFSDMEGIPVGPFSLNP